LGTHRIDLPCEGDEQALIWGHTVEVSRLSRRGKVFAPAVSIKYGHCKFLNLGVHLSSRTKCNITKDLWVRGDAMIHHEEMTHAHMRHRLLGAGILYFSPSSFVIRRIKSKCYPGVRDQAQSDHVYDVSRCCFLSPPLDQALLPNSWKRISRARTTNAPPWRLSERSLMICLERPRVGLPQQRIPQLDSLKLAPSASEPPNLVRTGSKSALENDAGMYPPTRRESPGT